MDFRKITTSSAVIELVEEITNNIEKKMITAGIFIDLKKAMYTVNHTILLHKLEHYGIRGQAKEWVKSYLRNRLQYVDIDEAKSNKLPITRGYVW